MSAAPTNYKKFWDDKASTTTGALLAVDGSANEDVARLTGAYAARQVRTALDLQPGDRVLELGCGVGRIGRELAPHLAHWEGADISANMLGVARERLAAHANVGLTELTRTTLQPLPSASFDKVYCIAVFIHMDKEDLYLYLEEIQRVLKPGGLVFFDTWNLAHPVGWRRFALELGQYRNANTDPGQRKDVARNQFSTPQEISLFLKHADFEELAIFADSPWVQAVAMKAGGERDVARERARVLREAERIVYSPLWTELFDHILRLSVRGESPEAILDSLGSGHQGEEIPMFRAWYLELWRHNQQHWGPVPARWS